jgi:acetylornithine/succinyldiaminopimelate/putrescine aminotransferase
LGGGMPLGAFIASQRLMSTLTHDPVLGHITTFGGHPVSCVAGKAALEVLLDGKYISEVKRKEKLLHQYLAHPSILVKRSFGLWMSLQFATAELNQSIVHQCVQNGLITDWFLFAPDRMRIALPLIITDEEIKEVCETILKSINEVIK